MIKIAAPNMTQRVCDRAMQSFGGMGMSADTPIASKWEITKRGNGCHTPNGHVTLPMYMYFSCASFAKLIY